MSGKMNLSMAQLKPKENHLLPFILLYSMGGNYSGSKFSRGKICAQFLTTPVFRFAFSNLIVPIESTLHNFCRIGRTPYHIQVRPYTFRRN